MKSKCSQASLQNDFTIAELLLDILLELQKVTINYVFFKQAFQHTAINTECSPRLSKDLRLVVVDIICDRLRVEGNLPILRFICNVFRMITKQVVT